MTTRSEVPEGKRSEIIPKGSRLQVEPKRPVSFDLGKDNEMIRSCRKRQAAQKIMNENYQIAENGCWEWAGGTSHGYGTLRLTPGGPPIYAHRLAYALAHGFIPEGQHILHKCDNPSCVNPTHLFAGTQEDNMKDMAKKCRSCLGERNGQAKLSPKAVMEIREKAHEGIKDSILAEKYGILQAQISRIVNGLRWKHVGGPIRKHHGNWKHGRYSAAQE